MLKTEYNIGELENLATMCDKLSGECNAMGENEQAPAELDDFQNGLLKVRDFLNDTLIPALKNTPAEGAENGNG